MADNLLHKIIKLQIAYPDHTVIFQCIEDVFHNTLSIKALIDMRL